MNSRSYEHEFKTKLVENERNLTLLTICRFGYTHNNFLNFLC